MRYFLCFAAIFALTSAGLLKPNNGKLKRATITHAVESSYNNYNPALDSGISSNYFGQTDGLQISGTSSGSTFPFGDSSLSSLSSFAGSSDITSGLSQSAFGAGSASGDFGSTGFETSSSLSSSNLEQFGGSSGFNSGLTELSSRNFEPISYSSGLSSDYGSSFLNSGLNAAGLGDTNYGTNFGIKSLDTASSLGNYGSSLSSLTPSGESLISVYGKSGLTGSINDYTSPTSEGLNIYGNKNIQTITKKVPYAVPYPVPVHVTKTVQVPQPYPVYVAKNTGEYKVEVKVPYPVEKPFPVKVPEVVPVKVQVKVPYAVEKPYPVHITKTVAVPVEKEVIINIPEPVQESIPQPYPVGIKQPVEVKIPHPVIVKVPEIVRLPIIYSRSNDTLESALNTTHSSLVTNGGAEVSSDLLASRFGSDEHNSTTSQIDLGQSTLGVSGDLVSGGVSSSSFLPTRNNFGFNSLASYSSNLGVIPTSTASADFVSSGLSGSSAFNGIGTNLELQGSLNSRTGIDSISGLSDTSVVNTEFANGIINPVFNQSGTENKNTTIEAVTSEPAKDSEKNSTSEETTETSKENMLDSNNEIIDTTTSSNDETDKSS